MNSHFILCLAALFATTVDSGRASDLQSKEKLSEEEIRSTIKRLVSPNKAPQIDGPDAIYGAGFDRDANGRVMRAYVELQKAGIIAFLQLIEHFDDKQYSFTADGGASELSEFFSRLTTGSNSWFQMVLAVR